MTVTRSRPDQRQSACYPWWCSTDRRNDDGIEGNQEKYSFTNGPVHFVEITDVMKRKSPRAAKKEAGNSQDEEGVKAKISKVASDDQQDTANKKTDDQDTNEANPMDAVLEEEPSEVDNEVQAIMKADGKSDEMRKETKINGSSSEEIASVSDAAASPDKRRGSKDSSESKGKAKSDQSGVDEDEQDVADSSSSDEGDSKREPGADATRYIDPDHLLPFKHGWKREVIQHQAKRSSATQCQVFYLPPPDAPYRTREAKRKRRSKLDQEKYFEDFPSKTLSVINFNYVPRPLGLNNKAYEIVKKVSEEASEQMSNMPSRAKARPFRNSLNTQRRAGVSYREIEESAGLLEDESDDDSDIEYCEGFDISVPVMLQVKQHSAGMRSEHKKRKKVRDPETCCTPPLAEDMLWSEIDEDPIGVYNDFGGRSSPATPPPLRAVKLTRVDTADAIKSAIESVKQNAKKFKVLKDEVELHENMACHDLDIRKWKHFVDNRPPWQQNNQNGLRNNQRPMGTARPSKKLIMPQARRNPINPTRSDSDTIKIKLPMKSVNGKRPVVELVMPKEGRYQPIKFSNNMQVTEAIPKSMFDQANRLRKPVYQRAAQVPQIGGHPIYLAINPSSLSFSQMPKPLSQSKSSLQNQNRIPTSSKQTNAKPNSFAPQSSSFPSFSPSSSPQSSLSEQVAILVRPQKGNVAMKPVLLNVPRRVAMKVKPGTTLSFSASNDQKYVVLDNKMHPPVRNVNANRSSSLPLPQPPALQRRPPVNSPSPSQAAHSVLPRSFVGATVRSNTFPQNLPQVSIIPKPKPSPINNGAMNDFPMSLNLPPSVSIQPITNSQSKLGPASRQALRRPPPAAALARPMPPKSKRILDSGEIVDRSLVVTPCTPYCPGVTGFPELECISCNSLYHAKCVGIVDSIVAKIKPTFRCKSCSSASGRSRPTVINLD